MKCPKCLFENPEGFQFCGECGFRLVQPGETDSRMPPVDSERKHVTILFSDMSGYTTMNERLDPEEVKEIMSRVFGEITKTLKRYDGFVEKFIGDAVMAVFGVPKAHEDDPVRAVKAAMEIHHLVAELGPQFEEKVGGLISMHSGIHTGLVVTGEVNVEKGTHGLTGDAINMAARLQGLAQDGEILVGEDTYRQAVRYFNFRALEPMHVKGKAEPVKAFKVVSAKEKPGKLHRTGGLRADLIGRKSEMALFEEAAANLLQKQGTVISLYGDAGTGKSRLVRDFKESLDLNRIQWHEGHAYAYTQNTPYYPLMDLLKYAFHIKDTDPPHRVREKVESGVSSLLGDGKGFIPYVGGLFSMTSPGMDAPGPELWKSKFYEAIECIFSSLILRGPTVICFEDLHWADPSFIELLRSLLKTISHPVLFICVYRPMFTLFERKDLDDIRTAHREVRLKELSAQEAEEMMKSLLRTEKMPAGLLGFVKERAAGNPFYLEEFINALIQSDVLTRHNGDWRLNRTLAEKDIPPTINGILNARLDRLGRASKRILQEASVIGRVFMHEILAKITNIPLPIDGYMNELERLDLIRVRSFKPELEYIFKHVLTQEVVYRGVLRRERRAIHERIGRVMESLFEDRLNEFCEILAYHFRRGESVQKAVSYLIKSGEKCIGKYAVEESHQYFKEAFEILSNQQSNTRTHKTLMIDLLLKWALVFYYRGDALGLASLLLEHESMALTLGDKERLGMLYAWLGYVLFWREKYRESYNYLIKARKIGRETGSMKVEGYACTWLPFTCAELGLFDEGLVYGERAREISDHFESDKYLRIKSVSGIGYIHFFAGKRENLIECAHIGIDYGRQNSDIRSLGMGYTGLGLGCLLAGNFEEAVHYCKKAVSLSADPLYTMAFRTMLGFSYLYGGHFKQAEECAHRVLSFTVKYGVDWLGTMAQLILSVVSITKGEMGRGLENLKKVQKACISNGSKWLYALSEYIMGSVYLQILQGVGPRSLPVLAKNIGFLVKNVPFAGRKAENHFNKAMNAAKEIGANGILGQIFLDLGLLHKAKKDLERARACLSDAIRIFEECEAEGFILKAKKELAVLQ